MVDVGRGLGELLELVRVDKWDRYGIEVSVEGRAVCEAKGISFNLPTDVSWCDLMLPRGSLQHLDQPMGTLFDGHK